MQTQSSTIFSETKPHYAILDGLRGVAALLVLCYHVSEAFATSVLDMQFNHGYLAVDFFFILSGFVVGYAYDNRWGTSLNTKEFFKRRLIRLHPMVVLGAILGAITFCIQGCVKWDGSAVSLSLVGLALLASLFLIPVAPGATHDVRGNTEMFPLNGPSWSLFFEYIGNILYALILRKLPTKAIAGLVVLAACGLAWLALGNLSSFGYLGVGWSMADHDLLKNVDNGIVGEMFDNGLFGGFVRVTFSFSAGLLMSRLFKPMKNVRGAFWICGLLLAVLLAFPRIGGETHFWANGIYELVCVIVAFPLIVYLGASGKTESKTATRVCKFFGDISYPLYVVHYPFFYLFYAWVWKNGYTFGQVWHVAVGMVAGCIALAWLVLKFYDLPLRTWLAKRR